MSLTNVSLPDLVGYIGAGTILCSYFMLQLERLNPDKALYSLLNGLGAAGILISLWFDPNWPSIVLEGAWLTISVYGLLRVVLRQT